MKTKTINLYLFKELSLDQQKQVIEKYRDFNNDLTCDLINYNNIHVTKLEEQGFLNPDISYSLSCCQGDGVVFDCNDFDFELLLKEFDCKHKSWIIDILSNYCDVAVYRNSYANFYCHEKTRYFEINTYGLERNCKEYLRILNIINKIDDYIENLRLQACAELENDLQADIDYLTSDDAIKDALIANEYYFNAETLEIECI